jgi:hypothetical protein
MIALLFACLIFLVGILWILWGIAGEEAGPR